MSKNTKTSRGTTPLQARTLSDLRKMIEAVAPNTDSECRQKAFDQLKAAIASFQQSYPEAHDNKRLRNVITDERAALGSLTKGLRHCVSMVEALPLQAQASICRKLGPRGTWAKELNILANVVGKAFLEANKKKDRPVDYAPGYLAHDVARVLRETLGGKVTMASDQGIKTPYDLPRNGAAYARLLRVVLLAAGKDPPENLRSIMREGKILLEELDAK